MPQTKFRIRVACRIAKVDHARFNEAVAAGNYPCAPDVTRGATRLFDEDDLVALFIYGRLLDRGFSPRQSGNYSCKIRDQLRKTPNEEAIVIIHTFPGSVEVQAVNPAEKLSTRNAAGQQIFSRLEFHIANVREFVRDEMQEEIRIVGEEDE
jgi:DNA-binding transcriptional MerR regulator